MDEHARRHARASRASSFRDEACRAEPAITIGCTPAARTTTIAMLTSSPQPERRQPEQPPPGRRPARRREPRLRPAASGGSSGSSGRSSGGSFGGRLHFFRVARRRHDGDQRLIEPADHAHVRRQLDLAEMLRIVDLEARKYRRRSIPECSRPRTSTSTVWVTILTVPPRFTPGACSAFMTWTGMRTRILRAFAQAQEIHVHRQVLHRVELEVARNDPVLGAVHVEVVHRGEEVSGIDALLELGMIDRDGEGSLPSP